MKQDRDVVSVALVARSIISKLEKSSEHLATTITFNCSACRDTNYIMQDGRAQRCNHNLTKQTEEQPAKKKFF